MKPRCRQRVSVLWTRNVDLTVVLSEVIGMAQDFVGANNINLLVPSGQFGTRMTGGTDAASPRYIFTHLTPVARCLFPEDDDVLLTRREDDGQLIEPEYYCPVIPLLLINGSQGAFRELTIDCFASIR